MTVPQGLFSALATISVAAAGGAIRYARASGQRLIVLETLYGETKKKVEEVEKKQIADGTKLALHDQAIGKIEVHIGSINSKLDVLPRLTTLLETLAPQVGKLVPREEIDQRFEAVHDKIRTIKS